MRARRFTGRKISAIFGSLAVAAAAQAALAGTPISITPVDSVSKCHGREMLTHPLLIASKRVGLADPSAAALNFTRSGLSARLTLVSISPA